MNAEKVDDQLDVASSLDSQLGCFPLILVIFSLGGIIFFTVSQIV